ncbi:hypothetical protein O181_006460 [Austropuccinia psidii MF-1]|uniref:Uncharacterized protein n=1 Tax=Austropuccinia psidii MF-1 TaxID=1389203 RepID=A0A9Q3BKG0_9BASI|nr:hypothetical protein [Austropuccinia psidii MF-1]
MPKHFPRGYELLLTHQELSGSREDHRPPRSLDFILFQIKAQKDKELAEEPEYFISRPIERTGNDPSFGKGRTSSLNKLQSSPETSPKDRRISREVPRTIRARGKANSIGTDFANKSKVFQDWSLQLWTVCSTWPGPF